ncbi:MAG TPA: hypothetical protein VK255_00860 [Patescibacteria group bacterium]|nr:hypothetical protein [Patescibacteria group bacterium]
MDDIKNIDDYINDSDANKKRNKRDYYIELVLFLILGVLLGVAIKTEAVKRITIGYNDNQMKMMNQDYNIEKMQKDLLAKQMEDAKKENASEQAVPGSTGGGNEEINPENNNQQ